MTTEIYIGSLAYNQGYAAVRWCADRFGPGCAVHGKEPRWYLRDLAYIVFNDDKDATVFLWKWMLGNGN